MIAALVCAVLFVSGPVTDVAAAPAVGAFSVLAASGTRVDGKELVARDRPLVVYLVPESQASSRLLGALREWWQPGWEDRVVLVFGAAIDASRAWFEKTWGDGQRPEWFADPDGAAWNALRFQGALGVAAIDHGRVEWKIDGVIADPAVLQPSMRAWIDGGGR
jgi:hypothetical protein